MKPEDVKFEVQKALHIAMSGRKGPVWLDIPLDVQGAMVEEGSLKGFTPEPAKEPKGVDAAASKILKALSKAKRPAILVGNGVRLSGSLKDFLALAKLLKVPVLTTWKAADFLAEDDPLFVGRPGIVAQRGANFVQQTADFLLILGTRLDLCQTGFNHPHFAPKARKFMVDIDATEMKKLEMKFALKLAMDVGAVIRALLKQPLPKLPDFSGWLAVCKGWQRKYPVVQPEYLVEGDKPVNTYALMEALSQALPNDAVIVPGSSGTCAEITLQAFKIKKGQRLQNTPGLGSMGFGLPACIGACLASGRKPTVSIIGDGGLQHNIQELETLKRLNLPIKIFILNNNGYGSIFNMQNGRFNGNLVACNPASGLTVPDTCKVAAAYGLKTCRIESQRGLAGRVSEILATEGTVICDVLVDSTVQTAPRLSSKVLENGQMVSLPMEELWPFLDGKQLADELSV
jgi:acetolactate synthase I/II/III large subunit